MRPKVVIVTLVAAFGLLGIVALLKGMQGKRGTDTVAPAPGLAANDGTVPDQTNAAATVTGGTSNPAVSEHLRAAVIAKEIEDIQNLLNEADGTNNPVIISALLAKLASPEADVRQGRAGRVATVERYECHPRLAANGRRRQRSARESRGFGYD